MYVPTCWFLFYFLITLPLSQRVKSTLYGDNLLLDYRLSKASQGIFELSMATLGLLELSMATLGLLELSMAMSGLFELSMDHVRPLLAFYVHARPF
jgi:hypothetical protein